jgi:S-DNA-T family DNA segregation ATPase FtsK/SpoIIIE
MAIKKKPKYPKFGLDFKNKTFHVVLGLIMICVSIVLFLAFVSFVFNWKQDFDLVQLESTKLLTNTSITVTNLLGKIGASLGHFFI